MKSTADAKRGDVFVAHELLHRCLGKVEFAFSILDRFLTRLQEDAVELGQAVALENCEQVSHLAHRLKGSAANVGAWRIHTILTDLEHLAEEQQLGQAAKQVEELTQEISAFKREQARWRSETS